MDVKLQYTSEETRKKINSKYADMIGNTIFAVFMIIFFGGIIGAFICLIVSEETGNYSIWKIFGLAVAGVLITGLIVIAMINKKKKDYNEGLVLLEQLYLKKVKPRILGIDFYLSESPESVYVTKRTLGCFKCVYDSAVRKNEIIIDCLDCIVKLSGHHLLKSYDDD